MSFNGHNQDSEAVTMTNSSVGYCRDCGGALHWALADGYTSHLCDCPSPKTLGEYFRWVTGRKPGDYVWFIEAGYSPGRGVSNGCSASIPLTAELKEKIRFFQMDCIRVEGPPSMGWLGTYNPKYATKLVYPSLRTWMDLADGEIVEEPLSGYFYEIIPGEGQGPDICHYCGADCTGVRQGWDCPQCGGN